MSAIRELRDDIEHAAVQGCGADPALDRRFVPNPSLKAVMTFEAISRALQAIDTFDRHSILMQAGHIKTKATKIFAILLLIAREALILDFLEGDLLDKKLPLDLTHIGNIVDAAGQRLFMEQQWWFLAPEFSPESALIRMNFPEETILPFTKEKALRDGYSKGTSGQISRIWIHPSHQNYSLYKQASRCVFVRKRIESPESGENTRESKDFKAESRSLGMLLRLRHHSIVHLLAAFTHGSTYNFIFPLADMDLAALLQQGQRPKAFENDRAFYQAMSGIASALEHIHDFDYGEQGIKMSQVGFHHDLKPENILVKNGNFLITDFGLSRFSDKESPIKFKWEGGAETYGPPEIDPEFRKSEKIDSCAVDLWSFGCIMIEVVAFVLEGSRSLDEFRKNRLTWNGRSRDDCFHRGKALKPQVITALERYQELSAPLGAAVQSLDLARRLLDSEPSKRREIKLATEAAQITWNPQLCGFSERWNHGSNAVDLQLHKAAATGATDEVKVLIENGVSITTRDEQLRTALHWAAVCNQSTVLNQLYEAAHMNHGGRLNEEVDSQGRTALSLAAEFANSVAVETILKEACRQGNLRQLVSQCDAFGMSPLHLASESGNFGIAKLLLNAVGDEEERSEYKLLKDNQGMTALHYAARNPECDLVLLLLFDGKEETNAESHAVRMANDCDDEGLTPLAHAEERGCTLVGALLAKVTGVIQKLTGLNPSSGED